MALRILFVAAEATPFSKVGGLADVAGSLPRALAARGHDVVLATPRHSAGLEVAGVQPEKSLTHGITFRGGEKQVRVDEYRLGANHRAWLIGDGDYFPRPAVYGEADDLERYLFFCQAVIELPRPLDWQPDVIHLNDWHTGPLAYALRNYAWDDEWYRSAVSVFTIHNLRYRGPDRFVDLIGPAIFYSNVVTTVSPTYAREILTSESGEGLDVLLNLRRDDLHGIVNGIDYDEFDPATDRRIAENFNAGSLERRTANKLALQERVGLKASKTPLVGMVARLSEQKGIDITLPAMERLLASGEVQFVLLGTGDRHYEEQAVELAERHPGQASVTIGFDAELAQQIYAGSDVFLMPSRFEPCGLGQMIAMRYGSIPVVRRTGGLADTVTDAAEADGVGFVFDDYTAEALGEALNRAITTHGSEGGWRALQKRATGRDFSWGASAALYEEIYLAALGR